jgi:hypothetical protein
MKKLEISTADLLKTWDNYELVEALRYAKLETWGLNPTSEAHAYWLGKELDYRAELIRRNAYVARSY